MSHLFLRSVHAPLAVHPITGHQGPRGGVEVQHYLFSTSVLEGVGGQHHAPAALPPGKTRYPLYRRLGGPQGRSGRVRKISPQPEFFFCSPDRPVRSQSLYRLSDPAHISAVYIHRLVCVCVQYIAIKWTISRLCI
jgi:hypothetical protein